ncbi:MAG: response regulator [Rikenellaceae bacterium]
MKRLKLLLLQLMLIPTLTRGSEAIFQRLDHTSGLSYNAVMDIKQDNLGFLWIATLKGLNRYDGHTIKQFYHSQYDLPSNIISSLGGYKDGVLIGAHNGISRYDSHMDSFTPLLYQGETIPNVTDILPVHNNLAYISSQSGIYRLENDELTKISEKPTLRLELNSNGDIWRLNDSQIELLTPEAETLDLISLERVGESDSETAFTALKNGEDNELWIGTNNIGLYHYKDKTSGLTKIRSSNSQQPPSDIIRTIEFDKRGYVWAGTERGLFCYDISKGSFKCYTKKYSDNRAVSDNSIHSLYMSSEDILWIGTFFGGVNYVNNNVKFQGITPSAKSNSIGVSAISSIFEDANKRIWFCSEDMGISVYDSTKNSFRDYNTRSTPSLSSNNVHAVAQHPKDGSIWIGYYNERLNKLEGEKITEFNGFSGNRRPRSESIYDLSFLNADTLILATDSGVEIMNYRDKSFAPLVQNLPRTIYSSILFDKDYIWFTSRGEGLFRVNRDGSGLKNYNKSNTDAITSDVMFSAYQDENQNYWFAGDGTGLVFYNPRSDKFIRYSDNNFDFDNLSIFSIEADSEADLWLSTNDGLLYFDMKSKLYSKYNMYESMLPNQFNYNSSCFTKDGEMLFGTINGVCSFDPNGVKRDDHHLHPRLYISNFSISGKQIKPEQGAILSKSINFTDELTLPNSENSIAIALSTVNINSATQTLYTLRYRMLGVDNHWITLENKGQSVVYSNLDSGTYTFQTELMSNRGEIIQRRDITINVDVHPLLAWYMILLYTLIVLGIIIYLLVSYKEIVKARYEARSEKAKRENTEQLNEDRLNFFSYISHDFKTPLAIISMLLVENSQDRVLTDNENRIVKSNLNKLNFLLGQLLEFRAIESEHNSREVCRGDIVKFSKSIFEQFNPLLKHRCIQYIFESNVEQAQIMYDASKLERIVANLLSNAFKHATNEQTVKLSIEVNQNNSELKIVVFNSGSQISDDQKQTILQPYSKTVSRGGFESNSGLGLAIVDGLIGVLEGELYIDNSSSDGTSFVVTLPTEYEITENTVVDQSTEITPLTLASDIAVDVEQVYISNQQIEESLVLMHNFTILLVEDNVSMKSILAEHLRRYFNIVTAQNGVEAMEKLRNNNIDIIISDIRMPEMDGYNLCHTVKNNKQFSHISVILISSESSSETKIKAFKFGADMFIQKPIVFEELTARINNLFRAKEHIFEHNRDLIKFELNSNLSNRESNFIDKLTKYVTINISNPDLNVDDLAEISKISRTQLYNKIKSLTNLSTMEFVNQIRMNVAKDMLINTDKNISEIASEVGFNTPSYFTKTFKKHFGKRPYDYRNVKE